MKSNSTIARGNRPTRSRAAFNSVPSVAVMDRTGRIRTIPWFRTATWTGYKPMVQLVVEKATWWRSIGRSKLLAAIAASLANVQDWYTRMARHAQLWWQA